MSKRVVCCIAEGPALDNSFERLTLEAEQQLNCRVCGNTVWRVAFAALFKKMRNKDAYEAELRTAMENHRKDCRAPVVHRKAESGG